MKKFMKCMMISYLCIGFVGASDFDEESNPMSYEIIQGIITRLSDVRHALDNIGNDEELRNNPIETIKNRGYTDICRQEWKLLDSLVQNNVISRECRLSHQICYMIKYIDTIHGFITRPYEYNIEFASIKLHEIMHDITMFNNIMKILPNNMDFLNDPRQFMQKRRYDLCLDHIRDMLNAIIMRNLFYENDPRIRYCTSQYCNIRSFFDTAVQNARPH